VNPAACHAVLAFASVRPTRSGTVAQAGVGVGAGVAVGFGVGVGVGLGVGLGVGVGVGVGFGVGVKAVAWEIGGVGAPGSVAVVPPGACERAGVGAAVGELDGDETDVPITTSVVVAVAPSTPPADRKPPPSVSARTEIATRASAAATEGRRPGRPIAGAGILERLTGTGTT